MCSLHFLFPVFSSWMVHGLSYSDSQSLGRMFRQNLVETELCLKESFSKIGDKSLSYIILLCIYIYVYTCLPDIRIIDGLSQLKFWGSCSPPFSSGTSPESKKLCVSGRVNSLQVQQVTSRKLFKRLNTLREGGVTLTKTSPLQNTL